MRLFKNGFLLAANRFSQTGVINSGLAVIAICVLISSHDVSAHSGRVNSNGCHTPGGAGSGNPCHCHAEGDRDEELACEDGAPVANDDSNGDDSSSEDDSSSVTWLGLRVEDELECEDNTYNSRHYAYGSNADVTIAASMGGIYGPYEDACFEEYTDVDVEHIVARKEAHVSGLCERKTEERYSFGNDLFNMTLASPDVNRRLKSDNDPGEWLPDNNACWFVYRVIEVKRKYDLSIDTTERDAMNEVLARCSVEELYLVPREECETPD